MRLRARVSLYVSLITVLGMVFAPLTAYAESLDPAYGTNGVAVTALSGPGGIKPFAQQSDGKSLVAGSVGAGGQANIAVARYTANGTPDADFGSGGVFTYDFGYASNAGAGVVVQSDGKLAFAGTAQTAPDNWQLFSGRVYSDGTLDTGYGTGGFSFTPVLHLDGQAVALQPDDKLIVVGAQATGSGSNFALARFNVDGTLDSTFGSGGLVSTHAGNIYNLPRSVALQSDGKILVVGADGGSNNDSLFLLRYNSDGTLDNSFGSGGYVNESLDKFTGGHNVVVQPDGKIVVTGFLQNNANIRSTLAIRYNANGSRDASFAANGVFQSTFGSSSSMAISSIVKPDGKILLAGADTNDGHSTSVLRQLNANGTLDVGFGTGGSVVIDLGRDSSFNVVLEYSGKLLLGGSDQTGAWSFVQLAQDTQLSTLSPAKVWVGLKNSDDVGVKFDLLVEAYKDGSLIGSGQLNSVPAGSSGFNNAKLNTIPFTSFAPVNFPAGSRLRLRVWVRNACSGSGHNSGVARLWFNDSAANSQFGATIGSQSNSYFLRNGFMLAATAGSGPLNSIDVQSGAKCSAFKSFGAWVVTP